MTYNVSIRLKYLCSGLICLKIKPVIQCQEKRIILEQQTDWWMIMLTIAMVLIGLAALLITLQQRKDSLRSYRIALLSLLLEQVSRVYTNKSTKETKIWFNAIKSTLAKWAPKEAKKIQNEIENKSK